MPEPTFNHMITVTYQQDGQEKEIAEHAFCVQSTRITVGEDILAIIDEYLDRKVFLDFTILSQKIDVCTKEQLIVKVREECQFAESEKTHE